MPFKIIRNDITKMETDAIVNTANPFPIVGFGTDTNIYKAAGYEQLLKARKELGAITVGDAVFTDAFDLPAKYIIHTAGPAYKDGKHGEEELLRSCYKNCLDIAYELGCKTVSFPLISAGNYGYPKEKALNIALSEINQFLMKTDFYEDNEISDMDVYLVIYDDEVFDLSSKIYSDIQSYIDSNYVEQNAENESLFCGKTLREIPVLRKSEIANTKVTITKPETIASADAMPDNLDELLKSKQKAFQDVLMQHIADRKLANKDVYKAANIDAKLFSKIICTKNYVPKKKNVMALAIGLKLSLAEADNFMASAGYAFSQSDKFDLIVRFYISKQNYDMRDLEEKLYTLTGKTLGNLIE